VQLSEVRHYAREWEAATPGIQRVSGRPQQAA
jgi:hypothetical protein